MTLDSLYKMEICLYIFRDKDKFIINKLYVPTINTRHKSDFHIKYSRLNKHLQKCTCPCRPQDKQ